MSILKNSVKILLLSVSIVIACICLAACGLFKDDSRIYIIPEEEFKSCVKTDDSGVIKKLDRKKLDKADLESLVTDEKYYAVLFAEGKNIFQGWLNFRNDVNVDEEAVYFGTKKDIELETDVSYPKKSNPTISGIPYAEIFVDPSGNKKSDYYIAVGFTANVADDKKFNVDFQFYEGSSCSYVKAYKDILHKKQITAEPSIKYLSYEDYMSGNFDGKLKDYLEVPVGDKLFAVIDYKLSAFKDIEETDTATVSISTKVDNSNGYKFRVEEFPTADYTSTDTSATASFRLNAVGMEEKTYRFIVSVMSESGVSIDISSEISANKISFLSSKSVSSKANINPDLQVKSKLVFTLSPSGTYYTVTGIGGETASVIKIPSTYNGKPVKAIADDVFSNYTHISGLELSETLETIGKGAFKNCTSIKTVLIPSGVTVIGDDAFAGCGEIEIYCEAESKPNGWSDTWTDGNAYVIWNYGDSLFTLNSDGASYTFSYSGVSGTNVAVPATYKNLPITKIAATSFSGNTELKKLKIPDSINTLSRGILSGCTGLESITVPFVGGTRENVYNQTHFGYIFGAYEPEENETCVPSSLKKVTVTGGEAIYWRAFYLCNSITSISLPDSVKEIGHNAFWCTSLTDLTLGNGLTTIKGSAFVCCEALTNITIPSSVTRIGDNIINGCTSLTDIIFEDISTWYRTTNNAYTGGTETDVSNAAAIATYLKGAYNTYYWYKK